MTWLLPMAIILPITGAALTLVASRRPRVQRAISVTVITLQLAVELTMLLPLKLELDLQRDGQFDGKLQRDR